VFTDQIHPTRGRHFGLCALPETSAGSPFKIAVNDPHQGGKETSVRAIIKDLGAS
jgi:hypothetical protein